MRKTDGIISVHGEKVTVDSEKFYDNLKLSLNYNGQDNEIGIYANAATCLKNAIIEIFESLYKGISVEFNDEIFGNIEEFLTWIYLDNNIELGIKKYRDFIEKVYNSVKKRGEGPQPG